MSRFANFMEGTRGAFFECLHKRDEVPCELGCGPAVYWHPGDEVDGQFWCKECLMAMIALWEACDDIGKG